MNSIRLRASYVITSGFVSEILKRAKNKTHCSSVQPLLWLLVLVFCLQPAAGQDRRRSITKTDLRFVNQLIRANHAFAYGSVSQVGQNAYFQHLESKIAKWSHAKILVRLMAGLADLECVNTGIDLSSSHFVKLPIRFGSYSDGIFVVGTSPEHVDLLGSRLMGIGKEPVNEVLSHLMRLTARSSPRHAARLISMPIILKGAGLIRDRHHCTYTLKTARNRVVRRKFSVPDSGERPPAEIQVKKANRGTSTQTAANYEFEVLADGMSLVLTYRLAENHVTDEGIERFAKRLRTALSAKKIKRLIVDVRRNEGGDSRLNKPLIQAIRSAENLNGVGQIFVLIDSETSGAGAHFAFAMEQKTKAVFVGTPTRHGPVYFDDARYSSLPDSKLGIMVALKQWQVSPIKPSRRALIPDIKVTQSFKNFLREIDSAKETALNFKLRKYSGLKTRVLSRQDRRTPIQYTGAPFHPPIRRSKSIVEYLD